MSNSTSVLSGAAFIKPNVAPNAIDGVFSHTPLLNTFRSEGRILPSGGSDPVKWNYVYGRDGAVSAWSENETLSNFGGTLSTQASQAHQYKKVLFGVTDFQLANQAAGGLYQDVVELEKEKAALALMKAFEDAFCGNGASVGISSLIDATGPAHIINQSTYSTWSSVETDCSGSLFVSALDQTYSNLLATNASPSSLKLFMSPAVATIYQTSAAPNMRGAYGQPLDLGKNPSASGLKFNGADIIVIPGASVQECYFVDMSKAHISVLVEPAAVQIPAQNMGLSFAARASMALILDDRACHAKIINIHQRATS